MRATGVEHPQQISLLLQNDGGPGAAGWKLAGFFTRPMTAAGHDGVWYWTAARNYAQKKQDWNAYFYYQTAAFLLNPVDFMSGPNLGGDCLNAGRDRIELRRHRGNRRLAHAVHVRRLNFASQGSRCLNDRVALRRRHLAFRAAAHGPRQRSTRDHGQEGEENRLTQPTQRRKVLKDQSESHRAKMSRKKSRANRNHC